MGLVSLQAHHHVRLFPDDETVVIAVLHAKIVQGLQQNLSLHEPDLVPVHPSAGCGYSLMGFCFQVGFQPFGKLLLR